MSQKIKARSMRSEKAYSMLKQLQHFFVRQLDGLSKDYGTDEVFVELSWSRDLGLHGGGERFVAVDEKVFNRASVNFSQVHYDDDKDKKLGSATALSSIIHPNYAHAPSMHMHLSRTEYKDGTGYWRIMADLNPSIKHDEDVTTFNNALQSVLIDHYEEALQEGEHYFYIPALKRHRGVSHFYLEDFTLNDFTEEITFVERVGQTVVNTYIAIVKAHLDQKRLLSSQELQQQIDYHTLYLFQVLTLDRGTTSGLLVHDQNDLGIMGSIPKVVDRELLLTFKEHMPKEQRPLLDAIVNVLPTTQVCVVDDAVKSALAQVVRDHYTRYPDALALQASATKVVATVADHRI